jgi:heme iron utilization protein
LFANYNENRVLGTQSIRLKMSETENLTEKKNALYGLLASQQTLLLATASVSGAPDLSYAPFVRDPGGLFLIFVSDCRPYR